MSFLWKNLQHLKVQLWISRTWFRCEASPVSPLSPINRATFRAKLQGDRCFPCFSRVFRFSSCFFQHFLPHVFPATAFFTVWKPFGRTRLFGLAKTTGIYILVRQCPLDFKIFYQTVPNICTIFMFTYFEKNLWASGIFGLILQSLILRHMGSCWNLKFWKYGKYGKLL